MENSQQELGHLVIEAEARIETAIAQLHLASKGITNANASQQLALTELQAAKMPSRCCGSGSLIYTPDSPDG